jgi:hypothetical protein
MTPGHVPSLLNVIFIVEQRVRTDTQFTLDNLHSDLLAGCSLTNGCAIVCMF